MRGRWFVGKGNVSVMFGVVSAAHMSPLFPHALVTLLREDATNADFPGVLFRVKKLHANGMIVMVKIETRHVLISCT